MNELQKDLQTARQMLKCKYFLKNVAAKFCDIALYIFVIVLYIVALFSPVFVGIFTESILWGVATLLVGTPLLMAIAATINDEVGDVSGVEYATKAVDGICK